MLIPVVIVACISCFIFGAVALYLIFAAVSTGKQKRQKAQRNATASDGKAKRSILSKIGTMNLILIIIGVTLLVFTVTMVRLFREMGAIPDTLVSCVFVALTGECGVMGWIKTTKDKQRDREYQQKEQADDHPTNNL